MEKKKRRYFPAEFKRQATERVETRWLSITDVAAALSLASGVAATLVFALHVASDDVQIFYGTPQLPWLLCPICSTACCAWSCRLIGVA
jgi:hypothetical protein